MCMMRMRLFPSFNLFFFFFASYIQFLLKSSPSTAQLSTNFTTPPTAASMHLMYTLDSNGKRIYTLKKLTATGAITKSAHPARFSPDDKYSRSVPSQLRSRSHSVLPIDTMMSIWPPNTQNKPHED